MTSNAELQLKLKPFPR